MSSLVTKCPSAGNRSIGQAVLCPLICACNQTPDISASGAKLKQQCVSKGMRALDKAFDHGSPVKAEVNYDMTKSPPVPIMSSEHELKPTEWLPAHTKDIPGFKPGKGMVRRPDAVVVRNPELPPTQDNLLEVVEIKFPPDTLAADQAKAYREIAGNRGAKFIEMSPKDCCCDDKGEQQGVKEAKKETASKLELLLLGLALVALVADDLLPTGATQADDALIPGILLRMGMAL